MLIDSRGDKKYAWKGPNPAQTRDEKLGAAWCPESERWGPALVQLRPPAPVSANTRTDRHNQAARSCRYTDINVDIYIDISRDI